MNLTLSVDDRLVERARAVARQQGTSLNALIRDYIEGLAGQIAGDEILSMRERSRIIRLMNKLTAAKRIAVVAALVEGNSIRATVRMTGVSKPTVLKLLVDLGHICTQFHDQAVRGVRSKRVNVMRSGSSVTRRRRTSPRRSGTRSDSATCGPGRRSTPPAN